MLGAAAWVKVLSLVLVPVWWAQCHRESPWRAVIGALTLSAALVAWLLALGGLDGLQAMVSSLSFQFQRGSFHAPRRPSGRQWLQPWMQAAIPAGLAWLLLTWPRDRPWRDDLVQVAGAVGALLLWLQLTANYWTWAYLPWAFPFAALALLCDRSDQPPATSPRAR